MDPSKQSNSSCRQVIERLGGPESSNILGFSKTKTRSTSTALCISRPAWTIFDGDIQHSASDHDSLVTSQRSKRCSAYIPKTTSGVQEGPASSFETLPSFLPEIYTIQDGEPSLFCYWNREVTAEKYTQVNYCAMLYRKSPRLWTRFTLSITTSADSKYWRLHRARSACLEAKFSDSLPTRLTRALRAFLGDFEDLDQDCHLSVFLNNRWDTMESAETSSLPITFENPPFRASVYLQEITKVVYHWNVPRYYEKDLIRRQRHTRRPNHCFLTWLQSRWVFEQRFRSSEELIEADFYRLQVLHCLRSESGIKPLLRVVLDDDTKAITGYLTEMPAKGFLFRVWAMTPLQSTGKRRLKWCKKIVQGVAEVHEKGFVMGSMGEDLDSPVAIDGYDNAVLWGCLQRTFMHDRLRVGVMPPEYRHLAPIEGSTTALPSTDIYQLGLLLWRLASNQPSYLSSVF